MTKCVLSVGFAAGVVTASTARGWLSPNGLVVSADGASVFVSCERAKQVLRFDTRMRKVSGAVTMPAPPLGLAMSPDGRRLCVACAEPEGKVCMVDVERMEVTAVIPSGHTTQAPVFDTAGKTVYVCNRFNNDVGVLDLVAGTEVARVVVRREPVVAALSRDGRVLLVANHCRMGRQTRNTSPPH